MTDDATTYSVASATPAAPIDIDAMLARIKELAHNRLGGGTATLRQFAEAIAGQKIRWPELCWATNKDEFRARIQPCLTVPLSPQPPFLFSIDWAAPGRDITGWWFGHQARRRGARGKVRSRRYWTDERNPNP